MNLHSLSDLLDRELRHLHSMEARLFDELVHLGERVTLPELAQLLRRKRALTVWHRERLRSVPRANGLELIGEPCPGLGAILHESYAFVDRVLDGDLRDVAIVAALRRIGAFERVYYESARRHAELLEEPVAMEVFERNLDDVREQAAALDRLEQQLARDEELAGSRRSA